MTIPIEKFGKDHWATFAYIETRIVDYKGYPDNRHMRTDPRLHPGVARGAPVGGMQDGGRYPTRLKGGETVDNHDDWSCLDDCEAHGLVEQTGTGMYPCYRLTAKGRRVASALRAHKGAGKNFAEFVYVENAA